MKTPYRTAANVLPGTSEGSWLCQLFGHKRSVADLAEPISHMERRITLRTTCPRCHAWVSPAYPYDLAPGVKLEDLPTHYLQFMAFHANAGGIEEAFYVRVNGQNYYLGDLFQSNIFPPNQ